MLIKKYPNWTMPNGRTIRIAPVARISTANQDLASLDAQVRMVEEWARREFGVEVPLAFEPIKSQGSGERLDRPELRRLEEMIDERQVDVVIAEDLSRIMRRMDAFGFAERCEDAGVRLVAINDTIDTARDDWRLGATFAGYKHEESNRQTSQRIRRQLDDNFKQGRCLMGLPIGLIRKNGSNRDEDLEWDPKHRRHFRYMFYRAETWSILRIAAWLNQHGISLNHRQVRRLLSNPIFIGERHRGKTVTQRKNKTGRRHKVKAPPDHLKIRRVPHLAIIARARFERVQRHLQSVNQRYAVGLDGKADARKGRPKKATAFPGQRVFCGVCGQPFYWGGNGVSKNMMCSGARAGAKHPCHVTASFDGHLARQRVIDAIERILHDLPDFDVVFAELVREEAQHVDADVVEQMTALRKRLQELDRKLDRAAAAILDGALVEQLSAATKALESDKVAVQLELDRLTRRPRAVTTLPSTEAMREALRKALNERFVAKGECTGLIDRLVPKIVVYPVIPIDHGDVVFCGEVEVDLAALVTPDVELAARMPSLKQNLRLEFFRSPQRIRILQQVRQLRSAEPDLTNEMIAERLTQATGERFTSTAVYRACKLDALMQSRDTTDPYAPAIPRRTVSDASAQDSVVSAA
jgi:DNA invertase Pin-like site-specific DNA recombinase